MKPQAELKVVMVPTDDLVMYEGNAKLHPHEQIDQIAASIEEFNFADPIAAWHNEDGESVIIEGHGRLMAARKLGIEELPVIYLDYLSDEQRRAYTIAHNSTNLSSGFDMDVLRVELENIIDIEMEQFGVEIDDDEEEFDFDGLDNEDEKKNVICSINFSGVDIWEKVKDDVYDLADNVDASVSVRMA